MSDGIPEEVRFGCHVCRGTAPTVSTDDLAWVVRITNELVKNSPHRVDFLHLPATIDAGRSLFAPLRDLELLGELRGAADLLRKVRQSE